MPIIRTVQIIIQESLNDGTAKVYVQVGTGDPVDTGIQAASPADAAKMVADKLGGRA